MEWNEYLQLEGTYNNYVVQRPDPFRDDQKLKRVIKGIVQMRLKHWQTCGINQRSRKPVPVFDHPLSKEMLPNVQSKPPLVQLWTIPTRPIAGYQREGIGISLSTSPPHKPIESSEAAPQPHMLQTRQAPSSRLFLTGPGFQPFQQLCCSPSGGIQRPSLAS